MKFLLDNKEWIFSGIGVAAVTFLYAVVKSFFKKNNGNIPLSGQYQQSSGSIQSNGDIQITNNFYSTIEEKVIDTSYAITKNAHIPSGSRLFMIKIHTSKNKWLSNIMSNPKEKNVYEHNSGPNRFKDIRAGDYVCIYDEILNIHLTGIVTVHKYFSVNDLLRYNEKTTNIGFKDKDELESFLRERKDKSADVLCTVFKVEDRYNTSITFKEFENQLGITIPSLVFPIEKVEI